MTVQATTTKEQFSGDGSTKAFSASFLIFEDSDIEVFVDATKQTLGTDYTVSGAGAPPGFTVTFTTAPASGTTVTIKRALPLTQLVDYLANDPFPAETHEQALDRLTMIAQQLSERLDRAPQLKETTTTSGLPLTFPEPGTEGEAVGWDSSGKLTNLASITAGITTAISSPSKGQILRYSGSAWENKLRKPLAVVSGAYTATDINLNGTIVVDASATVTLPAASAGAAGETIAVFNTSSGVVTVAAAGSDTIYLGGGLSTSSIKLPSKRDMILLATDGSSKWYILSERRSQVVSTAFSNVVSGGSTTITHDLAVAPVIAIPMLRCTTAELGYSVGDVVAPLLTSTRDNAGVAIIPGAGSITVQGGSGSGYVFNRTTGSASTITAGSWALDVYLAV